MAKAAKTVTFTKIEVTLQKLLDPYDASRGLVAVGDTMVVDADQAEFLEASGMAKILEEEVSPPWATPTPTPVAKPAPAPAPGAKG